MALSRVKVWQSGEVLTAAALNAEFDNVVTQVGNITLAQTVTGIWTFQNGIVLGTPLPIASGGTGASTASVARTNLGLGAIAVEAVPLALAKGGTGSTTASGARTNLGVPGKGATETISGLWTFSDLLALTNSLSLGDSVFWDAVEILTDGTNISINLALKNLFKVTLEGNRTLDNPTNKRRGTFIIEVVQDATGSRTLAYGADYKFGDSGAPALSTAANKRDFLLFYCDGTDMIFFGIRKGY